MKFVIFGVASTNLTKLINQNQKGMEEYIVADFISATLIGPDGQVSIPTTFTRQLTDITVSIQNVSETLGLVNFLRWEEEDLEDNP